MSDDAEARKRTLTAAQMAAALSQLPPDTPLWFDYDGARVMIGGAVLRRDGWAEIVEPGDGGLDPDIAAKFGNVVVPGTKGKP